MAIGASAGLVAPGRTATGSKPLFRPPVLLAPTDRITSPGYGQHDRVLGTGPVATAGLGDLLLCRRLWGLPAQRRQVRYLLRAHAQVKTVVVDHVLVAERDRHFCVTKPVPLSEDHVGYLVAGAGEDALDTPEFVAASMDVVTTADLHVAARDDIGRVNWLEPRDRTALDLLAGNGVVLDHLLAAVSLPSLGARHERRHIGGLQRLETRHGAEELDLVRLGVDAHVVVVDGNQPAKPLPASFLDRQVGERMGVSADIQVPDLPADLTPVTSDFSPDPELHPLGHGHPPSAFPGL